MGNGASVKLHPPHIADKHFKELLGSKDARLELFKEITKYQCDDHMNFKDRIGLKKLVAYFADESKKLYPDFHINAEILKEAYQFSTKKKKHQMLTKKDFHIFLPMLFLFIRLWDIFDTADKMVVEDQRVFKGEFMKVKPKLNEVLGVQILGSITEEDWEREFNKLDINGDGHVNFDEFCKYVVSHVTKPFDYAEEFEEYPDEDEAVNGEAVETEESSAEKTNTLAAAPSEAGEVTAAPEMSGEEPNEMKPSETTEESNAEAAT